MMGNQNAQPPQPKPFGIQDQQTATNQQGQPVAYFAGTRKIAVTWISGIYNLRAAEAPNQIPTKK